MSTALLELRVFWGTTLLRIDHRRFPWSVTVGQGKGVDVFVASDDLPTDVFELVRVTDGAAQLTLGPGMAGEVSVHGEARPVHASHVVMDAQTRAVVRYGGLTLALQFVEAVEPMPRFVFRDADHEFLQLLSGSMALHIAAIVTLLLMPYAAATLREEPVAIGIINEMLETARRPVETSARRAPAASLERASKSHSGQVKARGRSAPSRLDPVSRVAAMLRSTPALGAAGALPLSTILADLSGSSRFPRGDLLLPRLGTPGGGGRYGGTRTMVSGPWQPGPAPEVGMTPRKTREALEVSSPEVSQALPRDVIRRVVDRNRAQVRYCYEHELQRDQTLEGRIAMRWIIGATGEVVRVEVSESTVASHVVEHCLHDAIMRWRFPQPAGGGTVTVAYPFVFVAN